MSEYLARKLDTLLWCPSCQDSVLRSRKTTHDHTLVDSPAEKPNVSIEEDGSESYEHGGDEPMEVGGVYDVTIEMNMTFRFTDIVAYNDSRAKERANDLIRWGNAVDAHEMFTDVNRREKIYEDDDRAEEHNLLP